MNSLKTMLMVAVLGGVTCAVYMSINNSPEQTAPEEAQGWSSGPPQVSLPGDDGAPDLAMGGPNGLPAPGAPPIQNRSDELSPYRPFSERAPAPPFDAAPMPPEIAANMSPPAPADLPEPSYAPIGQTPPPVDSSGPMVAAAPLPADGPLPNFDPATAPPLPGNMAADVATTPNPSVTEDSGHSNPTNPIPASLQEDNQIRPPFAEFLAESRRNLEQGRFRETLALLSARYGDPDQTAAETAALTELLDQVAGTVIYSRQHHLEPAHIVQPGETLTQIAKTYNVSAELLAKINRVADPMQLQPGQELKVMRGPFRAVVRLEDHQMDLWLQDLYAGRFDIGVGMDEPELEGPFLVLEKNREPAYYTPTRTFDPADPLNPLGKRRLGLGGPVAIHGTNDPASIGQTGGPGAVRLGEKDADDVFDILSLGSRVVIQR